MRIEVEGGNLPGATCNPAPGTGPYENVHVGIGARDAPVELFRGDAPRTSWRFDVNVRRGQDGSVDFSGPMVKGKRGDRFLYLNWGTVAESGEFKLFRRAKISLSAIDGALIDAAAQQKAGLRCSLDLTDSKGNPTCARFQPPAITWRIS